MTENKYHKILGEPRHQSSAYPPMSLWDRAAQFAPFSALSGHREGVREVARTTQPKIELSEDAMALLDGKIQMVRGMQGEHPEVSFTYFVPDQRKCGGAYVTTVGRVKKIDSLQNRICLMDGKKIPLDEIVAIEGEIFSEIGESDESLE